MEYDNLKDNYDVIDDPYIGVNMYCKKNKKPNCEQLEKIING